MGSESVIEGLNACLEDLKNMTEEEERKFAEDYWDFVDAVNHARTYLHNANPSIIANFETQFSGSQWYPEGIHSYINAIYNILEFIEKSEKVKDDEQTYHIEGWTSVSEISPGLGQTLNQVVSHYFPELAPDDVDRITALCEAYCANEDRSDRYTIHSDLEMKLYADIFSVLSGRSYVYSTHPEADIDDILTTYYPADEYDREFISSTYIPGYLDACEEDRRGRKAWEEKRKERK